MECWIVSLDMRVVDVGDQHLKWQQIDVIIITFNSFTIGCPTLTLSPQTFFSLSLHTVPHNHRLSKNGNVLDMSII